MAKIHSALFVAACSLAVTGCASMRGGGLGGVIGAVAGGVICKVAGGNNTDCLAVAAVTGVIGYGIGSEIDRRDREAYRRSVERALAQKPSQFKPVTEVSQETGNRITVTSISNTTRPNRPDCKQMDIEYDQRGQALNSGSETWCLNSEGRYEPVR